MRPLAPALLAALACRPAVQAPDTLEEMVVFGFVGFDEPGHLEAVAEPLFAALADHAEALTEGLAVDELEAGDLAAVGVAQPEIEGILGALGTSSYALDPAQLARAITSPDKPEIYEDTERFDVRDEEGDRDCFLERACARYAMTADEASRAPVVGRVAREIHFALRWVTLTSGEELLAIRQLVPDGVEISAPVAAIDQQYTFSLVRVDGDRLLRPEATWIDARILGVQLPEGWAVRQAVSRMQQDADDMVAFFTSGRTPR